MANGRDEFDDIDFAMIDNGTTYEPGRVHKVGTPDHEAFIARRADRRHREVGLKGESFIRRRAITR